MQPLPAAARESGSLLKDDPSWGQRIRGTAEACQHTLRMFFLLLPLGLCWGLSSRLNQMLMCLNQMLMLMRLP